MKKTSVILPIVALLLVPHTVFESNHTVPNLEGGNGMQVLGDAALLASNPTTVRQPTAMLPAAYTVTVTAYTSVPEQTDDTPFITASGTYTRDGIIAANFLPIGTAVQIPALFGDKVFIVEDRMHSRYTYKLDVWMPTVEDAQSFGVRRAKVIVL